MAKFELKLPKMGESVADAQFLSDLLKKKIKVRFTEKPFTSQGKSYDRGTLIVVRGDNKHIDDFDNKLVGIANMHERNLDALRSGFSSSGPDFGSPDVKLVNAPKIAILSGENTASGSYGELWHFFEQQLHYPITSINTKDLSRANLSKYNVLIMPSGYYGGLLNESLMEKITTWVRSGGKLIAIDGALNSFVGKEGFGLKRNTSESSDSQNQGDPRLIKYSDRERNYANNMITGAIFKAEVDNTHPMAFGYDEHYFTLKRGSSSYSLLDSGYNVAFLGKNPKNISGFAGKNTLKNLDHSLIFGEHRLGRGSLIYMSENVMFRSFWENGKLFLVNALFFVNNNAFEL